MHRDPLLSFALQTSALKATRGNLSVHLKKLEDAGYVTATKKFVNNKPLTRITLTSRGRKAFSAYLEALAGLIGQRPPT